MPPVCRFAPSPNGFLHLGHAYSALCNERVAARIGAMLRLRLEDIDTLRCTPALESAMLDDLGWLGFQWSGSVRRQRDRFPIYAAALGRLAAENLLYPCFCTRGAIAAAIPLGWPRDPDGAPLYPGTCRALGTAERARRITAGEPHALRLDMAAALAAWPAPLDWTEFFEGTDPIFVRADPAAWGDAALRRKDIPASYHIAVTVDDAADGVTDIVRGEDLFAATGLHRLVQVLLGFAAPRYHHHRLVRDDTGAKLAKSRGSAALRAWRREGFGPEAVRAHLAAGMSGDQGSSVVSQ